MKDQFLPAGGGINIFRNALKPYFLVVETGNGFNEVFEPG
jgi:hypothetical protein